MSISRADLDAGRVDFSDLGTGERLPPVHPGEVLLLEYLQPYGITPYRLAQDIEVPPNRITEILAGRRGLSADTAMRLGRYFGTEAQFWMNLQTHYDLEIAR